MSNARTPQDGRRGNEVKNPTTADAADELEALKIDPPADGEVLIFRSEIRVVSTKRDPWGLKRLRQANSLLGAHDIVVDRPRLAVFVDQLPDPHARDLLDEAERLRRESDASRREAAEIFSRSRHRRRGAKKQQPIRDAGWSRDGDDQ